MMYEITLLNILSLIRLWKVFHLLSHVIPDPIGIHLTLTFDLMYPHLKNVREPFWITWELQDVIWATPYIVSYQKTIYFEGYI